MLQQITGKNVVISLGAVKGVTDEIRGEVAEVSDSWIRLTCKRTTELVQVNKIVRIRWK